MTAWPKKSPLDHIFGSFSEKERLLSLFNLKNGMIDDFAFMTSGISEKYPKYGKEVMRNIEEKISSGADNKINYKEIRNIITNNYILKVDLQKNRAAKNRVKKEFQEIHSELKSIITDILLENSKIKFLEPDSKNERPFQKNTLNNTEEISNYTSRVISDPLRYDFYEKSQNYYQLIHDDKKLNFELVRDSFFALTSIFAEKISSKNLFDKKSIAGTLQDIRTNDVLEIVFGAKASFHQAIEEKEPLNNGQKKPKEEVEVARNIAKTYLENSMNSIALVETLEHAKKKSNAKNI